MFLYYINCYLLDKFYSLTNDSTKFFAKYDQQVLMEYCVLEDYAGFIISYIYIIHHHISIYIYMIALHIHMCYLAKISVHTSEINSTMTL